MSSNGGIYLNEDAFVTDYPNHPVQWISWYGAMAYAEWLNTKTENRVYLPTEAEWEFAARGGNRAIDSKGIEYFNKDKRYSGASTHDGKYCWNWDNGTGEPTEGPHGVPNLNSGRGSHEVGKRLPNELGLYDMSGNLYEWVSTSWTQSAKTYKVIRSGWSASHSGCEVKYRCYYTPDVVYFYFGLRVAMSLEKE